MTEEVKAKERFWQTAEEIEVYFTPQCCECILNIDRLVCQEFNPKPDKYRSNEEICPKKQERPKRL